MKPPIRDIVLRGLDQQISQLQATRAAVRRPVHGWLRAVRESVNLTQASLAKKLGLSRQSYAALETSEARGAISSATVNGRVRSPHHIPPMDTLPSPPADDSFGLTGAVRLYSQGPTPTTMKFLEGRPTTAAGAGYNDGGDEGDEVV